jgi:hypothetical protein
MAAAGNAVAAAAGTGPTTLICTAGQPAVRVQRPGPAAQAAGEPSGDRTDTGPRGAGQA